MPLLRILLSSALRIRMTVRDRRLPADRARDDPRRRAATPAPCADGGPRSGLSRGQGRRLRPRAAELVPFGAKAPTRSPAALVLVSPPARGIPSPILVYRARGGCRARRARPRLIRPWRLDSARAYAEAAAGRARCSSSDVGWSGWASGRAGGSHLRPAVAAAPAPALLVATPAQPRRSRYAEVSSPFPRWSTSWKRGVLVRLRCSRPRRSCCGSADLSSGRSRAHALRHHVAPR